MASAFIVETERWNLTNELFAVKKPDTSSDQMGMTAGTHGSGHGGATVRSSMASQTLPIFIRGLASAINGAAADVTSIGPVNKLEVEALNASMKKDHATAIELMKKATALEEERGAPYGPPTLIKPSHELFGEILLRAGQPKEAAEKFQIALLRQPNRARSLIGLARAAAQSGDKATARATYTKFLDQWKEADANLPELREARDYLKQP
jgi:tetratricopeptide (TPR) repeat protein